MDFQVHIDVTMLTNAYVDPVCMEVSAITRREITHVSVQMDGKV